MAKLEDLSLGGVDTEIRLVIYALVGVHVLALVFWCCALATPQRHDKNE